jgi:hypothetical protein
MGITLNYLPERGEYQQQLLLGESKNDGEKGSIKKF